MQGAGAMRGRPIAFVPGARGTWDISAKTKCDSLESAYWPLGQAHMKSGDSPLKQRVADAMLAADKKTAHLKRDSEEYIRLWMQAFREALWRDTPGPDPD